jgi:pyridoxine/pyridoxamine 5'-phosphate oxidase
MIMAANYLDEIKEELQKVCTQKDHPFRFFTLATVGLDQVARLRTVVLREVSDNLKLTFYTDRRSKKITHIKENKQVSLLLYHPTNLLQLKIEGTATCRDDDATKEKYWGTLDSYAKKQYTSSRSPGSNLTDSNDITYLSEENHFCLVEITPNKIEYLKLSRPHHIRVRFSKVGTEWENEYLVP